MSEGNLKCDRLAGRPLPPKRALEHVSNLDLFDTFDEEMADSRASGEVAALRSQCPKPKAVSIPMGYVVPQISPCCFRRAHASQIARHHRIKVQFDQVRQMTFAELFGS